MSPSLIAVAGHSRSIISSNGAVQEPTLNGYGSSNYMFNYQPIGTNHQGIDELHRIKMSLKSNIESEVKWALSTLARNSINSYINFEHESYIGYELIRYLNKPYQVLNESKKLSEITQDMLTCSLDSLLCLRNLAQDLYNQQWLSQIPTFKKNLVDILKYLYNWFYNSQKHNETTYNEQIKYENQFHECLIYTIDLLEPLTCYYIDNNKSDALFHILLKFLMVVDDKYLYVGILKSISHLLIIWDKDAKKNNGEAQGIEDDENEDEDEDMGQQEEDDSKVVNNCVDAITDSQLESITNKLLIQDNEMNNTALDFLKMYLFSKALNEKYPNSIKDSQLVRLKKLIKNRNNFIILIKQLPKLTVSNLPLNDPQSILKSTPTLNLTKRSHYSGVPTVAPELNDELYKIILNLSEPYRASTWLHCCYEPTNSDRGEVTQISIWKAYENQFEEIWNPESKRKNTNGENSSIELKPLLPAVDFIRNVTKAFPFAEAKVITSEENGEQKKKFIIKGIQPRQFPTTVEIGKYEAMKPVSNDSSNEGNASLTIGHIDDQKFKHLLSNISDIILAENNKISKKMLNSINQSSLEILNYIVKEIFADEEQQPELKNLFKLYNSYWLLDLVYANPSLIESNILSIDVLKYLI